MAGKDGFESNVVENVIKKVRTFIESMSVCTDVEEALKESPEGVVLRTISNAREPNQASLALIQALLDRTWEQLNTGHWRDVPSSLRHLYSFTSLHKVMLLLQLCHGDHITALHQALASADQGLLLGIPTTELTCTASILSRAFASLQGEEVVNIADSVVSNVSVKQESTVKNFLKGVRGEPVPCLVCPSLEQFLREYFTPRQPLLLKGCLQHWPAFHLWKNLNYLRSIAGKRTVPVELGAHYVDPEWSQNLMTLDEFIREHVEKETKHERIGYLAQHPLFEQVPELLKDICIPEYCCLSDSDDEPTDPDINAWFGPEGTVSPLHFDPKHNLLAQVVGTKRVLLYPPSASEMLYPHEGILLSNTARVDPEQPDFTRFPEMQNTSALECILEAGSMLYIPPKWWHHVRSLSTSFSVSFWWC